MISQHFVHPSLIQSTAIPLGLAGRDLLVRARTGSGKTLAYAVPVIQNILVAQVLTATSPSFRRWGAIEDGTVWGGV